MMRRRGCGGGGGEQHQTCVGERQVMQTNNSTQTTTCGDGLKTESHEAVVRLQSWVDSHSLGP